MLQLCKDHVPLMFISRIVIYMYNILLTNEETNICDVSPVERFDLS